MNNQLVPTPIVRKDGIPTTVYRRPDDALGASKRRVNDVALPKTATFMGEEFNVVDMNNLDISMKPFEFESKTGFLNTGRSFEAEAVVDAIRDYSSELSNRLELASEEIDIHEEFGFSPQESAEVQKLHEEFDNLRNIIKGFGVVREEEMASDYIQSGLLVEWTDELDTLARNWQETMYTDSGMITSENDLDIRGEQIIDELIRNDYSFDELPSKILDTLNLGKDSERFYGMSLDEVRETDESIFDYRKIAEALIESDNVPSAEINGTKYYLL